MVTDQQRTPRRILVALDGSVHGNRAAEYAVHYAVRFELRELVLVHAKSDDLFALGTPPDPEQPSDPFDLARRATATARALLDAASIGYRLHTELGDPAEAIENVAQLEHVDEIIL